LGEYLTPGVYTENKPNSYRPIGSVTTTTTAIIGTSLRGKIGVPTLITSWSEYINKYAGGLDSPYVRNSDLAYSVRGFFQNSGKRAFINRVDNCTSLCAKIILEGSASRPAFLDEEGDIGEPAVIQEGDTETISDAFLEEEIEDNTQVTGFMKVGGLTRETNVVEYIEGMYQYAHKLAGREKISEMTFERGAFKESELEQIYFRTLKDHVHRTTITLEILNRYGDVRRTYTLAEAWASKIEIGELDATSDDVVVDKMTIQFEYFLDDNNMDYQKTH
jgi:phage tail-like protein